MIIELNKELEKKLEIFSTQLKKDKTQIIEEAINNYLKKLEKEKIEKQKKALEYFIKNPTKTGIKDLKAIQRIKSENIH